ncbi:MAG: family acetyltransferase [Friedmanniella sp.]|nr:family acetyltransferase [Friedmanniella sp.]
MPQTRPVTYLGAPLDVTGLPEGWTARAPDEGDLPDVVALLAADRSPGDKPVDVPGVTANLVGMGSWTRRQVVVRDPGRRLTGWAVVHDRAAGRTSVEVVVGPGDDAERAARPLLAWVDATAAMVAALRHQPRTQLDANPPAQDVRLQAWLAEAGYTQVRRWLQMRRSVTPADRTLATDPAPRPGVHVRRVREHPSGLPVAADVQTVHQVLEESFVDHFNSYRESFGEFVERLREDPWHRWDHWWIATLDTEDGPQPGGVLISSVSPPDAAGRYGSYIDYIGVHRRARGRGVAKALLRTVIADTAERERHWVGLEVDADSPTGADGLYLSLGWQTEHVTQSWHRDVPAAPVG